MGPEPLSGCRRQNHLGHVGEVAADAGHGVTATAAEAVSLDGDVGRRRELVSLDHDESSLDWGPLERLAGVVSSARRGVVLDADDFMWMGRGELDDGTLLHLYKHRDTRRYLNLDGSGHAWRYDHGGYVPFEGPDHAVIRVTAPELRSAAAEILAGWGDATTSRAPGLEL